MAALGSAEAVAGLNRTSQGSVGLFAGAGRWRTRFSSAFRDRWRCPRELDVIANNMANIGTAGFKARALRFEEYIMPGASADTFNPADQPLSYVIDKGSGLDFSSGAVERTGRELDVAMRGNTILAVQTPQGERYTRNGSFEIDAKGELVTSDGYKVLGDGGPILFNSTETGLSIALDGTISSSEGARAS